jgi:predicted porin
MNSRFNIAGWVGLAVSLIWMTTSATAADLGGNCCADLEERIAELEATTARKGNRKISLTVYGQINKAIVFWDAGDTSDQTVSENSTDESYVGVAGQATFGKDWKAGYVIEFGIGGYDDGLTGKGFGYGPLFGGSTNDLYLRQSNVYVDGPVGKVTLGLASQATDGIVEQSTANTRPASRMLSLRPVIGPQVLEVLDLFDGQRANLLRYDSPSFAGFLVSASWAPGNDLLTGDNQGDVWDVALRYAGEFAGFKVAAGVGYREGVVLQKIGNVADAVQTVSGSLSVMHVPSGVFLTGAAGQLDTDVTLGDMTVKGWQMQGGVEQKWFALGKTTLFGEYGELDLAGWQPNLIGLGLVQNIESAGVDVYVSGRKYQTDDLLSDDVFVGMVGAKVKF